MARPSNAGTAIAIALDQPAVTRRKIKVLHKPWSNTELASKTTVGVVLQKILLRLKKVARQETGPCRSNSNGGENNRGCIGTTKGTAGAAAIAGAPTALLSFTWIRIPVFNNHSVW
mmetsp:Transcript_8980/g.18640  ORF Transcript_8980/g.18640 Transcript_8980/m.18640 type:complete len:116 (-) Transcript_8980:8-355(-)